MKNLQAIVKKYAALQFNEDNYSVGGGLSSGAFASNRHQDAKYDEGKLTEGKATQMFIKATGNGIDYVKAIINHAVPNMEWHHAGKLPKEYGGGMKKTYFLNCEQIVKLAINWQLYCDEYAVYISKKNNAANIARDLEARKQAFLQENAKRFIRQSATPMHRFYILTAQEMNGKYGWFDSAYKSYNLPEYFSGWDLENEEKYNKYLMIK